MSQDMTISAAKIRDIVGLYDSLVASMVAFAAVVWVASAAAQNPPSKQKKDRESFARQPDELNRSRHEIDAPDGARAYDGQKAAKALDTSDAPAASDLSAEHLEKLKQSVLPHIVRVVARKPSQSLFHREATLYFGHAVWVERKQSTSRPALLTTWTWLDSAETVYLVPDELPLPTGDNPSARVIAKGTRMAESTDHNLHRWFDKHGSALVELQVEQHKEQFNLCLLTPPASERASEGIEVVEDIEAAGSRLYGVTTYGDSPLSRVEVIPKPAEPKSISYYFATDFAMAWGGPIVTSKGTLFSINAMRHPRQEGLNLTVPPNALGEFLRSTESDTPGSAKQTSDAKK